MLMNLKQMGFSIEGISLLKLRDAIELTNYYIGDGNSGGDSPDMVTDATQSDIDKMLGRR